jgi:hypothetical protein
MSTTTTNTDTKTKTNRTAPSSFTHYPADNSGVSTIVFNNGRPWSSSMDDWDNFLNGPNGQNIRAPSTTKNNNHHCTSSGFSTIFFSDGRPWSSSMDDFDTFLNGRSSGQSNDQNTQAPSKPKLQPPPGLGPATHQQQRSSYWARAAALVPSRSTSPPTPTPSLMEPPPHKYRRSFRRVSSTDSWNASFNCATTPYTDADADEDTDTADTPVSESQSPDIINNKQRNQQIQQQYKTMLPSKSPAAPSPPKQQQPQQPVPSLGAKFQSVEALYEALRHLRIDFNPEENTVRVEYQP